MTTRRPTLGDRSRRGGKGPDSPSLKDRHEAGEHKHGKKTPKKRTPKGRHTGATMPGGRFDK